MATINLRKLFQTMFCIIILVGCGNSGADYGAAPAQRVQESADNVAYGEDASYEEAEMAAIAASDTSGAIQSPKPASQRLIIKTGRMVLNVENTDAAVANATDLIVSIGGYIVEQNVYNYSQDYRAATLSLGVPVDQFEAVLKALRSYGIVDSESASGQDVTEEYVDLNSRLENLQATQTRLREFLVAATNVEEALAVDTELRQVEGELNVIQGRIKFLSDRAAFSTISLEINPIIPATVPVPQTWQPGGVAKEAIVDLQDGLQNFIDGSIYFVIAVLPWLLVWGVIVYVFGRIALNIYRRVRNNEPEVTVTPEPAEA